MHIFIFFTYFLFSSLPLQATQNKSLSECDDLLDLSGICITIGDEEKSNSPGGWKRPGQSVSKVIDDYIKPFSEKLSKVTVIDLSSNSLTEKILSSFVEHLEREKLWSSFKSVELVCLENNRFTEEVAPILERFLDLYSDKSEEKLLPYISIVQNSVSLSMVNKLAQKIKKEDCQVPHLMSHLVFMKKYYIWHAVNRVQAYSNMVRSYELPRNWRSIQTSYYKSNSFKRLVFYRNEKKNKKWIDFVSASLNLTNSTKAEESHVSTDSSEKLDATEIEIKELADLVGGMSLNSALIPSIGEN